VSSDVLKNVKRFENEHDDQTEHRQLDQCPQIEPRSSTESHATEFHLVRPSSALDVRSSRASRTRPIVIQHIIILPITKYIAEDI
jgi:hypothetical protein